MKKVRLLRVFIFVTLLTGQVGAYELGTHAAMTQKAFEKSVLADSQFQQDLGLDNGDEPFGKKYLDVSGTTINERDGFDFEKSFMPKGSSAYSITGWLMRGAIREDDLGQILGKNVGSDPHDDPYGSIFRVFNHFYDPVLNRPLTVTGLNNTRKAPDWAIGSSNAFTAPNTPESNRRNHFTIFDAREAMYRALTGRDSKGNIVAATETERNKYWATTFRALGDVVHLLQDMGQPQHTRNDPHSGVPGFGHSSIFEEYIEKRATNASSYNIDGITVTPLDDLTYDNGYPIPAFTKYSDYWSTRNGAAGLGLADYSNRGFFTAGTNLGKSVYQYPSNSAASYTPEPASGLLNNSAKINFLKGNVNDYNSSTATPDNIRLTTESIWDFFLGPSKSYSLNRYNYNDMADLLIPRTVAYSAGLINYFFRGKLDWVIDPNNAGKFIIKNLGKESMTGDFTLYYDAVDGKRYPVAGDTPTQTWKGRTIASGGQLEGLSFSPPVDPVPTSDEYVLVFNGDMGEEKASTGVLGAVVGKVTVDPLALVADRVLFYTAPSDIGALYGLDLRLKTNTKFAQAVQAIPFTGSGPYDFSGSTTTMKYNGESMSCRRWELVAAGIVCSNQAPFIATLFAIDALGDGSITGNPWLVIESSLKPQGSLELIVDGTTLLAFTFVPDQVAQCSPVKFSKTRHFSVKNAVLGNNNYLCP